MSGLGKTYNNLPPWSRGLIAVGIGVVAYVVYNRIYTDIKNKNSQKKSREVIDSVVSDLMELKKKGIVPSYSDAQYKIWADAAYSCYEGWGTCTGDTIFINMKNDADVLKLIEAFGVRTIPSGRYNPTPDFVGALPAVIRDELSASDVDGINRTLAKKGITYKF